jgi:hypothetical protein
VTRRPFGAYPLGGKLDNHDIALYAGRMTIHIDADERPFVVCPTCEGHGTHGPGHVYTMDEVEEAFGPEADEVMAEYRAGTYDVRCETCKGQRVVRADCSCDECEQTRFEIAEMEAMERAERAFGC